MTHFSKLVVSKVNALLDVLVPCTAGTVFIPSFREGIDWRRLYLAPVFRILLVVRKRRYLRILFVKNVINVTFLQILSILISIPGVFKLSIPAVVSVISVLICAVVIH